MLLNIKQRSDFSLQTKSTWNPKLATVSGAPQFLLYLQSTATTNLSCDSFSLCSFFSIAPLSSTSIEAPQFLSLRSLFSWQGTRRYNTPKIEEPHDSSIDEELTVDLSSIPLSIDEEQFLSLWSLFNWRWGRGEGNCNQANVEGNRPLYMFTIFYIK